jgi:hypothetical protein
LGSSAWNRRAFHKPFHPGHLFQPDQLCGRAPPNFLVDLRLDNRNRDSAHNGSNGGHGRSNPQPAFPYLDSYPFRWADYLVFDSYFDSPFQIFPPKGPVSFSLPLFINRTGSLFHLAIKDDFSSGIGESHTANIAKSLRMGLITGAEIISIRIFQLIRQFGGE